MNDLNVAPSFFCSEFQMEGINNCWVHALKFSLNFLLINLSLCPKRVELSDWEEIFFGFFFEPKLYTLKSIICDAKNHYTDLKSN